MAAWMSLLVYASKNADCNSSKKLNASSFGYVFSHNTKKHTPSSTT